MEKKAVNDLNILAEDVLKLYGILPKSITVIQGGTIKTVWKIETQDGYLCLKRLKQAYDRALFSVHAQVYIKNKGGNVPGIILNKQGNPISIYDDQLFVVYEWLEGKSLDFNENNDLVPSITGLARFHINSRGYSAYSDSKVSSKLGRWPSQYNSMKLRLLELKETAKKSSSQPQFTSYLASVNPMIDLCDLAIYMIGNSPYESLCSSPDIPVLCHQDYGKGNALSTSNGVIVLDLDGVTFDLPARDLRKIIGKRSQNKNIWDTASIKKVLDAYSDINPLSPEEKEVLYIDLVFPHWFFGLVKNMSQPGKIIKASEIEAVARLEQSKTAVLGMFKY